MKLVATAAIILLAASQAYAGCFGSKSFSTCQDDSGNNYTISRFGNSTHMDGYNSRTGSNWSQDSYSFGKTTNHYGRDADGNSWSTTCYNGNCY